MMRSIFGLLVSPLFVLFVVWPEAWAQLNDFDRQEFTFENALAGKNPGFESGTVQWTASGGTFVVNSGTQIVPNSKQFATWDSNASGQTLQTAAVTVPKTGNCEFSIWIAVPSGTATHTITVTDGTNDIVTAQTITNNANALKHIVNFSCPSSGTVRGKLTSVASNEPSISLDNARLGTATNVGVADLTTETASYALAWTASSVNPTISNGTLTGVWRRDGDRLFAEISVVFGSSTSAGTGEYYFSIPSQCTPDTSKMAPAGASQLNFNAGFGLFYDSSLSTNSRTGVAVYTSSIPGIVRLYLTGTGSVGASTTGVGGAGDRINLSLNIPCVGWSASQVVMPDAQGWFASGEISGGGTNISLGVVDVTSYTEMTNATLTLTPDSGSAAMGIMCSGTNAAATPSASATTCSAGSESVGAAVNIPRSGRYEACFDFSHNVQIDSTEVIYSTFNVIQTPTNAQTLTQEGGPRLISGTAAPTLSGGTLSTVYPIRACGQLNLSAGLVGIRLMYEQAVANNPNASLIYADQGSGFGQRSIRVSIKPVSSQQQAILANSVTTANQNGDRILRGHFNCDGSSAVLAGNEIGTSSIGNISSGACVVTFSAFSSAPQCVASIQTCAAPSGAGCFESISSVTTATTSTVRCKSDSGADCTSSDFYLICAGPR